MADAKDFTDAATYPVFLTKSLFMNELRNAIDGSIDKRELYDILFRLSRTNTASWVDGTTTLAAAEAAE